MCALFVLLEEEAANRVAGEHFVLFGPMVHAAAVTQIKVMLLTNLNLP